MEKKQRKHSGDKFVSVTVGVPGGLSSQTTKSEEMAILRNLRDVFCGTSTYLEGLFTEGFVDWCGAQIRQDFPCDIHRCLMGEIISGNGLSKAANEKDLIIGSLRKEIDDKLNFFTKELSGRDEKIRSLNCRINSLEETACQAVSDPRTSNGLNSELDDQIKTLKIKLYDLTAGGKS